MGVMSGGVHGIDFSVDFGIPKKLIVSASIVRLNVSNAKDGFGFVARVSRDVAFRARGVVSHCRKYRPKAQSVVVCSACRLCFVWFEFRWVRVVISNYFAPKRPSIVPSFVRLVRLRGKQCWHFFKTTSRPPSRLRQSQARFKRPLRCVPPRAGG